MTAGATGLVQTPATRRILWLLDQPQNPRHLVRVYIKQSGFRIERSAAPFAAAVEAGKDYGAHQTRRRELPVAADLAKAFERSFVCFGSAVGEHLFSKLLSGEGQRQQWQRLFFRELL